jgi:formate hydrogenlyase subunit 6/NADH:ubiquinone oxidoreductase subunit I
MPNRQLPVGSFLCIDTTQLQVLINALRDLGYRTIGPRLVESAVVYSDLETIDQLPAGYIDHQDGGTYRLEKTDSAGYFDYAVGPDSLKRFLFPPRETLVECLRDDGSWKMAASQIDSTPLAVIGARSCELHALAVQDKVFLGGPYVDPGYQARRQKLFVAAVNCRRAVSTCFCHSMNAGPALTMGFDLALTEVSPNFIVEIGTATGAEVMSKIEWAPCTRQQVDDAREIIRSLEENLKARANSRERDGEPHTPGRFLNTVDIHDLLLKNLDHPRWTSVADRCLACANCTMVCPTCFCAAVEEVSDLTGDRVRRERIWDSCFTAEHSYMNTGTVRKSTASRYRQWLTHKLATWIDQFGTSGCVGCGRCITWCPVGIDLTEEVAAIRGDNS